MEYLGIQAGGGCESFDISITGPCASLTSSSRFILEGLFTIVVGVASKFVIPDWPEQSTFLNNEEKQLLIARLTVDVADAKMNRLDIPAYKRIFSDWKVYCGVLMYFGIVNTGYATSVRFLHLPSFPHTALATDQQRIVLHPDHPLRDGLRTHPRPSHGHPDLHRCLSLLHHRLLRG